MTRLVRNIGYNVVGQLVLLVLAFVAARYIFTRLGKDVLGILYFTLMLNSVVAAVLELGVTTTTVKEIAANQHGDPAYVRRIAKTGAFVYWAGYGVVAIALLVAAPWIIERWIDVESITPSMAVDLLRILGAAALLQVPQSFYASVFRGLQRMGVPNAVDIVAMLFQHAGTIVLIAAECDVRWVAFWIAATYLARPLVLLVLMAKQLGANTAIPTLDRDVVRRNAGFAGHMVAISILAMLHTQADKFVISLLMPVAAVGVYGLLFTSVARGAALVAAVAHGAFPTLSEFARKSDRAELVRTYHRLQDLMCVALVPVFALVGFLSFPIFSAVLDETVARTLALPAVLLGLGSFLNGTLMMPYFVSLALDRPDIASRQNFVALFTTLPVTLAATYFFGMAGAAAGWVWYQLFAYVYSMPRLCRECLGIAPAAWFGHVLRILGLVAVCYGASAAIVVFVLGGSTAALVAGYVVATVTFLAASWTMMVADSRDAFRETVRRVRSR